jgi:hypothetical protein
MCKNINCRFVSWIRIHIGQSESGSATLLNSWNKITYILQAFRYFVIDQSVVLGVLEEQLGNSQDPTLTAIIRFFYTGTSHFLVYCSVARYYRLCSRIFYTGIDLPYRTAILKYYSKYQYRYHTYVSVDWIYERWTSFRSTIRCWNYSTYSCSDFKSIGRNLPGTAFAYI